MQGSTATTRGFPEYMSHQYDKILQDLLWYLDPVTAVFIYILKEVVQFRNVGEIVPDVNVKTGEMGEQAVVIHRRLAARVCRFQGRRRGGVDGGQCRKLAIVSWIDGPRGAFVLTVGGFEHTPIFIQPHP